MSTYDEQILAELIALLPPAPPAWVAAAQQLGPVRSSLDAIVERARADSEYRRQLLADLEVALKAEGVEPEQHVVERVRRVVREL